MTDFRNCETATYPGNLEIKRNLPIEQATGSF